MIVTWNPTTRQHYEKLGYKFTKYKENLVIRAKDLLPSSMSKVTVRCDKCGAEMKKRYGEYLRIINKSGKYKCKSCATKERMDIVYPKEERMQYYYNFCEQNNYIPLTNTNEYNNCKQPLLYICKKHGEQKITLSGIIDGNKCKYCSYEDASIKLRHDTLDVKRIIESKNNNTLLNPEEYINARLANLKIKCGSCGKIYVTSLSAIMNGKGHCLDCGVLYNASQNKLTSLDVDERFNVDEKVLLNPQDYINNSTKNLKFICSSCRKIFISNLVGYSSGYTRCKKCNNLESKGEYLIAKYLDANNIKYERQKRFPDCIDLRTLPFDFYLPDYNCCIEFDGLFHYSPSFGNKQLHYTQKHDKIKNAYCENNNIKLIRIPYFKSNKIIEIIERELRIARSA